MKMLASAALAATLLAGPALADAPAPSSVPPPATAPSDAKLEAATRAQEKRAKDLKSAKKPSPKPGAEGQKDPPCEPVKPCPIE